MYSLMINFFILGLLLSSSLVHTKKTEKRGISGFDVSSFAGELYSVQHQQDYDFPGILTPQPLPIFVKTYGPSIQKQAPYQSPVSPAEIASAIQAAKEASSRVHYAQQRVQAAKDAVIEQQKIASIKESQAAAAQQRSEAAAAAQRQTASAAAQAVIMAQQKLAEAKAEVAEQQRIAAAKESIAAHVIQKSANAAAAEIQRTENKAAKIAAIQRSESAAAVRHVTDTKDATLAATSAAVNAASNGHHFEHYSPPPSKWNLWN